MGRGDLVLVLPIIRQVGCGAPAVWFYAIGTDVTPSFPPAVIRAEPVCCA